MADKTELDTQPINESGASENSLSPGGGTSEGDLKTNTIADIVAALGSMGPDDLNGFKASLAKYQPAAGEGTAASNEASIAAKPSYASTKGMVKEDLQKIFSAEEGEAPLSEAFIDQASTLFESAVTLRVATEVEAATETLREEAEAATAALVESYNERMDSYLDYVAEQFIKKNEVAIDSNIRSSIQESVIADIKKVFESHNLSIDDGDVDVVGQLQEQVAELTERLNETLAESVELKQEIENNQKAEVLADVMEGLSDVQKDHMIELAEDISFDTETFRTKMEGIKAKFFAEATEQSNNGLVLEEDGVASGEPAPAPGATGVMGSYVSAISRSLHK